MSLSKPPYAGDGTTLGERGAAWPAQLDRVRLTDPRSYLADDGLVDAANVALTLQQPLLLTGEPGTGKTQFATSLAYELELPPPLTFHTKSTSTVTDLFYSYDALRHFHDSQFQEGVRSVEDYVEYACLGLAILLGMPAAAADSVLPDALRGRGPTRSVVLIDEIDKAPRDVPNDMLNEIEQMAFTVKETGGQFTADPQYRPILVLTSNSEKALPDAFLRRCVFYHISFPDRDRLRSIVRGRLGENGAFGEEKLENALEHFEELRSLDLRKPPATAELLEWMTILQRHDLDVHDLSDGEREVLAMSYSLLAKSRQDLAFLKGRLD